jgi:hypothetical protein
MANTPVKSKSEQRRETEVERHNREQEEEMNKQKLDTTPDAAEKARAQAKADGERQKKEDVTGEVGEHTGEETATKVNTTQHRIVDQTEQREQAGRSASEPLVVTGYTLSEQGDVKKGKALNGVLAGVLKKMPLSTSEREIYDRYPGRAIGAIRSFLNSRTDAELVELLSREDAE